MIHLGQNQIDGVPVEVIRKRVRRINLRVREDASVRLTLPDRIVTLEEAWRFLSANWDWVLKTRDRVLTRITVARTPPSDEELASLESLLKELHGKWSERLSEHNVTWKVRRVKSVWGCCHMRSRSITYNADLARAPVELVEYVVVHEFTHFTIHNHGPDFYRLMDIRLPGWQTLRRRLKTREWENVKQTAPS